MRHRSPGWSQSSRLVLLLFHYVLVSCSVLLLATAQTTYECPQDWMSTKDYCYKFEASVAEKYDDAWSKCNMYGAGLVHIEDKPENSFVTRWLQVNDPYEREWYTSGVIFSNMGSGPPRFAWQSTGLLVDVSLSSVWLETPRRQDEGVIVYAMGNTSYGWRLGDSTVKRQYICKIHKNEAYRIHFRQRGDDFGVDTRDIDNLQSGPVFLLQPKSLVVVRIPNRQTQSAVLECIAQSNPTSVYRWYRGDNMDRPLTSALDSRYTITNGKLEISEPHEDRDSGFYTCTAENKYGKLLSERVEITFGYLREFNNVQDAGTIVSAYDGAKVECSQISYKPAVSYQWMKGDYQQFIRSQFQSYIFISNNGKLYFSEVTTADEADYTCIVALRGVNQYKIGTSQPPMRTSLPIPLVVIDQAAKASWGPVIQDEFIQVFPSPPLRGYDVRLECFAYGSQSSPFKYMWSRDDGKPLPSTSSTHDHNRVLFIRNAQLEHEGVYRCSVSRGSSRDTKTINFQLSAQPYFVSPLRNQRADIGSQLTWICGARGKPNPIYTWYKNGQRLLTDRSQRVVVQSNVLTIADLDKDLHDGVYQCGATNALGTSLSTAQLKVLSFPPNFDKHPATPEVMSPESGDVTLPCIPEGAPHPTISWDKDGAPIASRSDKYNILGNGYLRIRDLTPQDEGDYTCTAINIYDSAKVSTLLKITGGASITIPMSDDNVIVNQTVMLRCEASFPAGLETVYEWKFNDHIIDYRDGHYKQVQESREGNLGLYVVTAQLKHEGTYTCTARTPFNSAITSGYLTVYGPPKPPAGVDVLKSSVTKYSVELRWTAGTSKGDVVSYHIIQIANEYDPNDWTDRLSISLEDSNDDEGPEKKGLHSTLIEGLHPGTSYRFRVLAINSFGRGENSIPSPFIRTLNAPPAVAPSNLRGGGGSVGLLTIRWDALRRSEYGGLPVKYRVYWRKKSATFKNEKLWSVRDIEDPNQNMMVVYVGNDHFYLLYDTIIQAFSSLGFGPNSTMVSVYSAEGLPLKSPENVRLTTYNSTAIHVTWTPVPDNRLNVRGKLKGYQINYWNDLDQPEDYSHFIRFYGQHSEGMVIGLEENVDMRMDVQIFNTAGLGPRSNKFVMETSGYAPLTYPQEVHVSSAGVGKVFIWWRGISLTVIEEALKGFAIWVWVATEEFSSARMIDVDEIVFEYTVDGIKEGYIYALRLAAVGGGGYGVKTPTMYFTMEGQILLDSNFASTIDVYLSDSTTPLSSPVFISVLSLVAISIHILSNTYPHW